jgi:hypothetical protein
MKLEASVPEIPRPLSYAIQVKCMMAVDAESYEILFCVLTLSASRLDMMNLQVGLTPAILTTPAIPLQDSPAQPSVPLRCQAEAGLFLG